MAAFAARGDLLWHRLPGYLTPMADARFILLSDVIASFSQYSIQGVKQMQKCGERGKRTLVLYAISTRSPGRD
jgi:hypothetical protein